MFWFDLSGALIRTTLTSINQVCIHGILSGVWALDKQQMGSHTYSHKCHSWQAVVFQGRDAVTFFWLDEKLIFSVFNKKEQSFWAESRGKQSLFQSSIVN